MTHFLSRTLSLSRDSLDLLRCRCCRGCYVCYLLRGCVGLLLNRHRFLLNGLNLDRSFVGVFYRLACGRCESGQTLVSCFLRAFLGRCSALGQRAFDCAEAVSRGLWVHEVNRATNAKHHAVDAVWLACNLDTLQVINLLDGWVRVVQVRGAHRDGIREFARGKVGHCFVRECLWLVQMVILHQLLNNAVALSHCSIDNRIADNVITTANVGVFVIDSYVLLVFTLAGLAYRDDGRVDVFTIYLCVEVKKIAAKLYRLSSFA